MKSFIHQVHLHELKANYVIFVQNLKQGLKSSKYEKLLLKGFLHNIVTLTGNSFPETVPLKKGSLEWNRFEIENYARKSF